MSLIALLATMSVAGAATPAPKAPAVAPVATATPATPATTAAVAAAPDAMPAIAVPYEKYTLPNGLTVILSEDHSVPFVQVNVWYWVGSKDEKAGRTGFAHLFEHLMFQGSEHANDDYFQFLSKVGGQVNGTTNLDRTNYFEGLPASELPRALFLESDRMGWLLPALDDAKLQNQKDVVRNERRQRYDNVPYGHAWIHLYENLFPEGHPYHVPTIGKHEDIEAAQLADVKEFFSTWYVPQNASLVVCGDFDPAVAKGLIAGYFGDIPGGTKPVPREVPQVALTAPKRIDATDDVPFEKVWLAWPSPALNAPGDAELDLLSSTLTDGKDSPLYRVLVREKQVAQDVQAAQVSNGLQSFYMINATVAPGHTGDELVREIDRVLEEVKARGVSVAEVGVARTQYEVGFYGSVATIAGKADRLNSYFRVTGEPDGFAADLGRYRAATAETVNTTLRTVLGPNRLELHIAPEATK
ncbi:MAG: pitrilysin family protein [Pseudomonadota bacterium]|nr:pitrilysin family protein [Pseudomonadota bacterium]